MAELRWSLLSGEYPPRRGGVADYTAKLAQALAAAGDRVTVWAPGVADASEGGVTVRGLPDLGPAGVRQLRRGLDRESRLLVQYAPHALGLRGLNLPLCMWLARRRPWVMFHEVHFPRAAGAPWRERILGGGQALMAGVIARGAARCFVSTGSWIPLLRSLAPTAPEPCWLPVFSNLPEQVDADQIAQARRSLPPGEALIGHFGTHGAWFEARLQELLPALLRADPGRLALLMGRGAEAAAARLGARRPELLGRVLHREGDPAQLAAHLGACDLVLQPYVDGPTTRRGTLMAALALGRAVVSNEGHLTEPFFRREPVLRIAPDPGAIAGEAERLLAAPGARAQLGAFAAETYRRQLSLARTVERLREEAACA